MRIETGGRGGLEEGLDGEEEGRGEGEDDGVEGLVEEDDADGRTAPEVVEEGRARADEAADERDHIRVRNVRDA